MRVTALFQIQVLIPKKTQRIINKVMHKIFPITWLLLKLVNAIVDLLKLSSSFCLVRRRLLGHNAERLIMIIYSNYRVLTNTTEEIFPEPSNQSSLISSYKKTLNSLKNTLFSHSNDWIRRLLINDLRRIASREVLSRKFNQTLNTTPVIFFIIKIDCKVMLIFWT